jgi:uncharacterized protein
MHDIIRQNQKKIEALCREFNVSRLEVFGSAARVKDFDPERSDADFLVEFIRPSKLPPLEEYLGFREELMRLLGRSVDLVEARAVRNPYLRRSIDESRELVFAV